MRTAALVVAGLWLLIFLFQERLVYYPDRQVDGNPGDIGLDYEEVSLRAPDGARIAAWFVPAPQLRGEMARGVILYCHGNGGNISHRLPYLEIFHRLGFDTLLFDYRGYGESEGEPSEQGTYEDAEAAWQYLTETRGVPAGRIVIYGHSLGGAIAAWLASRHPPAALVLEAAFTSFHDIAAHFYPWVPVRLLARFDYDTAGSLRQVRAPVLVLHSRGDELIPFTHGEKLFESAPALKHFIELRGDHNAGFLTSGKIYEDGLAGFLESHPLAESSAP